MRKAFLLLISFITTCSTVRSQETMMKDIDYDLLTQLVQYAKNNYPRIQANLHRIKVAEANIAKTKLSYFDVLTFSYVHSPQNSTTLVNPSLLNGYQYGVFVNLGTWAEKPAQVRAFREEKKALQYEKLAYDQNVEMEVRKRYLLYVQQLSLLRSRSQALMDAEDAVKQVKYHFERGATTFDEYSKALVMIEDHHQKRIEAEGAMLIAKAELEELLGKELEEFK